jgi:hypothetical protein
MKKKKKKEKRKKKKEKRKERKCGAQPNEAQLEEAVYLDARFC